VNNYGPEWNDDPAAHCRHCPADRNRAQQNAQLQRQLAVESRRRLDSQIAAAVPDYQQVDRDPAWHRWLLGIDTLSGRVRQTLLNEAIAAGDPHRVKSFFDGFRREAGGSQGSQVRARSTPLGSRTYTREDIGRLYEKHRKGEFTEATWNKIEADIFAAQHDGRIQSVYEWIH
jgi:hypothetical protein